MHKRQRSKQQYDKHTKDLPELQIGQNVRMRKHPIDKHWQFGTCTNPIGNRSYIIDLDGKSYRRNRRDIRPTRESYDANKLNSLPLNLEDNPLVIPKERHHIETVRQPTASEINASPTSDKDVAVDAPTKVRSSSRKTQLPAKFKDFVMT